jgi:hypothetical protein
VGGQRAQPAAEPRRHRPRLRVHHRDPRQGGDGGGAELGGESSAGSRSG